jgi:hypothetical protein
MGFFTLIVIVAVVSTAGVSIYMLQKVNGLVDMVYVMDINSSISAASRRSSETVEGRMFEYEDHVRTFYTLWYSFDENTFETNIERALYLIGNQGKDMLTTYTNSDIHASMQQKNIFYEVKIIDVKINMETKPRTGYIEGIQTVKGIKGQASRTIDCTFSLHDQTRSRQNPHGIRIEEWKVISSVKIEDEENESK